MRRLTVLSNSALTCYRRCQREFSYRYVMLRRPVRTSDALRFGTIMHTALESWWSPFAKFPAERLGLATEALRMSASEEHDGVDEFTIVRAEELLLGYTATWGDERLITVAIEREFSSPLVHPITGEPSGYMLAGKIDAIARAEDGKLYCVEHKTTSSDIEFGSSYWQHVSALDPQVSTYLAGGRAAGYALDSCLYDVIRKVSIRPFVATPDNDRRYTLPKTRACKGCGKRKDPTPPPHTETLEDGSNVSCVDGRITTEAGGRLYSGMRDRDETPNEYRVRVRADIESNPTRYFARGQVVRLPRDEDEHALDTWQTSQLLAQSEVLGHWPRNAGACSRFGSTCEYFDVCAGHASIADDSRFRTSGCAHEELKEVA